MLKCENPPRTNSTKSETQNFFAKIQRNEHTPGVKTQDEHRWSSLKSIVISQDKFSIGKKSKDRKLSNVTSRSIMFLFGNLDPRFFLQLGICIVFSVQQNFLKVH